MRPIAIALLSVVGLAVMTVPSHARRCFVTVEDTDQWGNPDPSTFPSGLPTLTPPLVVQRLCQVHMRVRTIARSRPRLAHPG